MSDVLCFKRFSVRLKGKYLRAWGDKCRFMVRSLGSRRVNSVKDACDSNRNV